MHRKFVLLVSLVLLFILVVKNEEVIYNGKYLPNLYNNFILQLHFVAYVSCNFNEKGYWVWVAKQVALFTICDDIIFCQSPLL